MGGIVAGRSAAGKAAMLARPGGGTMGARFDSIFRPGLFDGKTMLVTGGGTGIGRCTAHELAALGANVVIAARRKQPLDATAAEIASAGGRCETAQLDIRDAEAVDATVAALVERHGRIDGLVNNAGGQFVAPAAQISPNGWRTVIDLNLNGSFLMSSAVYRHSMQQHGGAIVNMLADVWTGYPAMAHMAAARAGIANLSITLSMEWAASDVRVNCVAPGTILSSGMLTYPRAVQETAVKGAADSPPARLGTESEVSAAIVFLLSPGAAYITGVTLEVDGGSQFHKGRLMRMGRHRGLTRFDGFHLKPDFSGTPFAPQEEPEG
jgi:citronellol/citronellal dehydrogenase